MYKNVKKVLGVADAGGGGAAADRGRGACALPTRRTMTSHVPHYKTTSGHYIASPKPFY